MAIYKVIQDIEAEDKLLGPLTLRQFIYAGAAVLFYYLTFLALTKGAAFMSIVFLPIALIGTFFAWPWSRDQPTEIWALAKIRFLVKPRVRIWNQSGVKELVTITAPRKIQAVYTNGLTQTEVQSRLRALAETIDSRGWAIKNVNVNMYQQPNLASVVSSDRLIDMATIPQQVPELDIQASDDVMESNSPISRQFDTMIEASTKAHRQEILNSLQNIDDAKQAPPTNAPAQAKGADYWFLNQPSTSTSTVPQDAVTFNTQVVSPHAQEQPIVPGQPQLASLAADEPPIDENALIEKLREQDRRESYDPYNRWHRIQPLSQQGGPQPSANNQQQSQPAALPIPGAGQQAQYQAPPMVPATPQQAFATPPAYDQPVSAQQMSTLSQNQAQQMQQQQVTASPDPAILQLASNDDLNVATIAREANKRKELQDEVVISLH